MPSTRRERSVCGVEGLEGRRLLAGQVVGAVVNDMRFVDPAMGATGLAGWVVYVDADNDGARDAGEASAVTDLDGAYRIVGVEGASVEVRAEAPKVVTIPPRRSEPARWAAANALGLSRVVDVSGGKTASAAFSVRMIEPVVVDLLVAYTPAARAQAGGEAQVREDIAQHVRDANRVFANSDTNVLVRPVGVEEVGYVESGSLGTDLERVAGRGDGYLEGVHGMRDRVGADLVVLYEERRSSVGEIGIGYVYLGSYATEANGFSVVTHEDGALPDERKFFALAHEVAHNMGADHDPANVKLNAIGPAYARGIRVETGAGALKDVMAYGTGRVLPVLSKPGFVWAGVEMGNRATADNARVVRESGPVVATYREKVVGGPVVDPPVVEPPVVEPPVVEPPVVDPPVVDPPVVDPPIGEPPVTEPPVVNPPVETGVDLAVGGVSGPVRAGAGQGVQLAVKVMNEGEKRFKGKVRVEWFLSKDKVLDEGDVLVKRVAPEVNVRVKKGVVVTATGLVGRKVKGGRWFVLARVDGNGRVAEDEEGNNVKARGKAVEVEGEEGLRKRKGVFGERVIRE